MKIKLGHPLFLLRLLSSDWPWFSHFFFLQKNASLPQEKLSVRRHTLNDDHRDGSAPQLYRSVLYLRCAVASVVLRAWRQLICTYISCPVVSMLHEYCAGILSLLLPHFFSILFLFFFFLFDRPTQNLKMHSMGKHSQSRVWIWLQMWKQEKCNL